RLGGEDLFGEVLGGVGFRRRECGGLTRNGLPALKAELRAGGQLGLTVSTDGRQTSSALQTELGLDRVFVLAPRTLHRTVPRSIGVLRLRHAETHTGFHPTRPAPPGVRALHRRRASPCAV